MARDHVNMDQDKRIEAIHDLELKHQEIMHQSNVIVKEEDTRRHRLRSVVLRDENATLREQLSQKDVRIKKLAQECDGMRDQLEAVNRTCQDQQKQLRAQARDQSNLKSELQSLSSVTTDSAKLLSEKLALSRELAVLKPELEHLRSQLSHQNDVLAEKLALERQLNTLEVELANEKRANQKILQRQASKDNEIEEDLRQQVADLEKKLAKEQRATEKAKQSQASQESEIEQELRQQVADLEKKLVTAKKAKQSQETTDDQANEALRQRVVALEQELAQQKTEFAQARKTTAKEMADAQNEQEILQQRLEEMKTKLRQTRAELKEARGGPAKPQNTTTTIPTVFAEDNSVKKPTAKAQARRKRRAEEISVDEFVLHTPTNTDGRLKRPVKKRGGLDHTLVGEKSAFSITPFLNKTINITEVISEEPESPEVFNEGNPSSLQEDKTGSEPTESEPSAEVAPEPVVKPSQKATVEPAQKKARGRPPKAKALAEASPSKKNMPPPSSRKNLYVESTITKVMDAVEESGKENRPTQVVTAAKKGLELKVKTSEARTSGASASGSEPEPKKKKRKLLGGANKPTLFDDDDAEAAPAPKRPAKMQLNVARGMGRVPLGVARSGAFGGSTFSPLKKERRGVNASFLA
ncbi:putative rossmann-fold nad (+)-binding protein [Phaeoacremonium minimum UCRPA7]|uniref:Putative rossmann-fold nad (+)-binding protein n=1 Tax=Phaeoacremonium minimum (strain UCR-PA7) TaxID=1286976 RepID=R8BQT1_PHAM7|nr:putative rossmann-fold nad (+)-binding protein [Phaeoacremonium minimum UCRPA7]EOO01716.1 putative rossmann-fold nad (+)-binding protein [Phaeoacremonium minimum UCRPA7]